MLLLGNHLALQKEKDSTKSGPVCLAILYNYTRAREAVNGSCWRLQIPRNDRRDWFLVTRGLIQLNEIPTICYLFCCGEYDFVSSFKVHREKFDRSGYFFLGAYFSRIRHALFGGIKVWEEVGCKYKHQAVRPYLGIA